MKTFKQFIVETPATQKAFEKIAKLFIKDLVKHATKQFKKVNNKNNFGGMRVKDMFGEHPFLKYNVPFLKDFIQQMNIVGYVTFDDDGKLGFSAQHLITTEEHIIIFLDNIQMGKLHNMVSSSDKKINPKIIEKILMSRLSTIVHELQHNYDKWMSDGKHRNAKEVEKINKEIENSFDKYGPGSEYSKKFSKYEDLPHEISARYSGAVTHIRHIRKVKTFKDARDWFKTDFIGWKRLSKKQQKQLMKRLSLEFG